MEPFKLGVSHYDLKHWPPGQLSVPDRNSTLDLTLLGCDHLKLLESRSMLVPVTSSLFPFHAGCTEWVSDVGPCQMHLVNTPGPRQTLQHVLAPLGLTTRASSLSLRSAAARCSANVKSQPFSRSNAHPGVKQNLWHVSVIRCGE